MQSQADPLSALRDIHLPPDPAAWPPAPGWWVLAILALALLVWISVRARRRYRESLPRRAALATVEGLRSRHAKGSSEATIVAELSTVLRRAALYRFPRGEVAGLAGDAWLEFLDETGGESGGDAGFVNGPGNVLVSLPYGAPSRCDDPALLGLCEGWIRRNL